MMLKNMKYLFLLAALLLTGCATESNYRVAAQSWVGEDVQYFQTNSAWGYCQDIKKPDAQGNELYIYDTHRTVWIPPTTYYTGPSYYHGHHHHWGPHYWYGPYYHHTPGYYQHYRCNTIFAVNDQIIQGVSISPSSNDCTLTDDQLKQAQPAWYNPKRGAPPSKNK